MKRSQPQRVPSPTPTAFSGISNNRTDSYRPLRVANNAPAVPTIDCRLVSKTRFTELSANLVSYLARGSFLFCFVPLSFSLLCRRQHHQTHARPLARSSLVSRSKQFHELSTDVYDELIRRKNQNEGIVYLLPILISILMTASPLPARLRRVSSQAESSSSKISHPAHITLRRSFQRRLLRACPTIS
jgi:hypothetical protein